MKSRIVLGVLALMALLGIAATVIKTSEFPNVAVPNDTDLFLLAQAHTNANISWAQIKAAIPSSGGSEVWTNDGRFVYFGTEPVDLNGKNGPPMVIDTNTSSVFLGQYVFQDTHPGATLYFPYAVNMTDSNQVSSVSSYLSSMDSINQNFWGYSDIQVNVFPDQLYSYFKLYSQSTNQSSYFSVRVDPNGTQGGTGITFMTNNLVVFDLSSNGVTRANGYVDISGPSNSTSVAVSGTDGRITWTNILTQQRYRSSTTNAVVVPCPDGGSFILTIGNNGTLNVVTNTGGL